MCVLCLLGMLCNINYMYLQSDWTVQTCFMGFLSQFAFQREGNQDLETDPETGTETGREIGTETDIGVSHV